MRMEGTAVKQAEDELTAAAERIRQLAEAATPGDWCADGTDIYANFVSGAWVGETLDIDDAAKGEANTAHIVLFDPPTALLVAELLEGEAARWAPRPVDDLATYLMSPACKLARHITGRTT